MSTTATFIKQMVDAIASAGKEMKKAKGKAPPKGQYRPQSPAPSGKATTAATPKKEIDKIRATNKRNKDMFGIGDDTPKYKQRAKRTAQVGVTGVTAAASFSALPSKAELSKSIKSYLGDKESPTAAQAKAAGRKALKDADLDASQIKAIMNKVDTPKAEPKPKAKSSKKADTDAMSFGKAFQYYRKQRNAKGEMPKTFMWRGKKYTTQQKDEQISAEKFNKGGYNRPRKGSMDYRKGGLFK
jgi:hypothetical protein